jgi:hypothetical protein
VIAKPIPTREQIEPSAQMIILLAVTVISTSSITFRGVYQWLNTQSSEITASMQAQNLSAGKTSELAQAMDEVVSQATAPEGVNRSPAVSTADAPVRRTGLYRDQVAAWANALQGQTAPQTLFGLELSQSRDQSLFEVKEPSELSNALGLQVGDLICGLGDQENPLRALQLHTALAAVASEGSGEIKVCVIRGIEERRWSVPIQTDSTRPLEATAE